jgi:regulator of PEP synthase PpsR (kinase-PPPase family)
MYLALQYGVFVANYPLVDEDFESSELPRPIRALRDRCFGLVTTPQRLSQVRAERRPHSKYCSLEQCTYELRKADALFRSYGIPTINSSAASVEEMSTMILQALDIKS